MEQRRGSGTAFGQVLEQTCRFIFFSLPHTQSSENLESTRSSVKEIDELISDFIGFEKVIEKYL